MDAASKRRLGIALRKARDAHAKTQEALAGAAGISIQTVRRAEQTGTVSHENLGSICSALDLNVERVITEVSQIPVMVDASEAGQDKNFEFECMKYLSNLAFGLGFTVFFVIAVRHILDSIPGGKEGYIYIEPLIFVVEIFRTVCMFVISGINMRWIISIDKNKIHNFIMFYSGLIAFMYFPLALLIVVLF